MSLTMFIYMGLRFQALPRAGRKKKERHDT